MTKYTKTTIGGQLRRANQLLASTKTSVEIQALVAVRGYADKAIEEGQSLYDAAVKAVNMQAAKAGAQRYATERANLAERDARVAYQELVQGVRALFPPNSPERKALDVSGQPTVATADFLAAASTLFNNALSLTDIGAKLAQYGYDQPALLRGRDTLLAYQEALQRQAHAKSSAVQATANQTAALDALHRWTAQYTKFAKIALRGRPDLLKTLGIASRRATAEARAAV